MEEVRLGMMEAQFAEIVWEKAPMTTRELVERRRNVFRREGQEQIIPINQPGRCSRTCRAFKFQFIGR